MARLLLVAIVYVFAYVYSMVFATSIDENSKIAMLHKKCIVGCAAPMTPLISTRGENYFINATAAKDSQMLGQCLVTFWGLTHYLLYFVIGLIAPTMFWPTFAAGVAFEFYEKEYYDCHDIFDIILNTLGFASGAWLSGQ